MCRRYYFTLTTHPFEIRSRTLLADGDEIGEFRNAEAAFSWTLKGYPDGWRVSRSWWSVRGMSRTSLESRSLSKSHRIIKYLINYCINVRINYVILLT